MKTKETVRYIVRFLITVTLTVLSIWWMVSELTERILPYLRPTGEIPFIDWIIIVFGPWTLGVTVGICVLLILDWLLLSDEDDERSEEDKL